MHWFDETAQARVAAVAALVRAANLRLEQEDSALRTGFVAYNVDELQDAIRALARIAPRTARVLDLGCGTGSFALLAAAAGFDSVGIELNQLLVQEAERLVQEARTHGLLAGSCTIVQGDMILPAERDAYRAFIARHPENPASMPTGDNNATAFAELGIDPCTADIIYCYAWPTQSRFIYNSLDRLAKPDAIFVLPCYLRYTRGEHLNAMLGEPNTLILQERASCNVFIGSRVS